MAQTSSLSSSRRQVYAYGAAIVAVCLVLLYRYLYDTIATSTNNNQQQSVKLKYGQPKREGHGFADEYTSFNSTCVTPDTTIPKVQTKPIWVASYPGSGAELVRDFPRAGRKFLGRELAAQSGISVASLRALSRRTAGLRAGNRFCDQLC